MAKQLLARDLAGSRVLMLTPDASKLALALRKYNDVVVSSGGGVRLKAPLAPGAEVVELADGTQWCLPHFGVTIPGGFESVPAVEFERRDEKVFLCATLEESVARRARDPRNPQVALTPLEVKVESVTLRMGGAGGALAFGSVVPERLDPGQGPALRLRVEAELYTRADGAAPPGMIPMDRVMDALVNPGSSFEVQVSFAWHVLVAPLAPPPADEPPDGPPPDPRDDPRPFPRKPITVPPRRFPLGGAIDPADGVETPVGHFPDVPKAEVARKLRAISLLRPEKIAGLKYFAIKRRFLDPGLGDTVPSTPGQTQTEARARSVAAYFPTTNASYRVIYAAITGEFGGTEGWRRTEHGWWKPASGDAAYIVPDEYRIAVDRRTGLPAITALLVPAATAGAATNTDAYRARVTVKVEPQFDPARLDALREDLRTATNGSVERADLILGGYQGARFTSDESRMLLADVFAGASATESLSVNPEVGFTLTYEGTVEFIQLLYERLKLDGLRDWLELELQEPGGALKKMQIPVRLAISALAPLPLETELVPPSEDRLSWALRVTNPSQTRATVAAVQARALHHSPTTRRVEASWPATWAHGPTFPLALDAGQTTELVLAFAADEGDSDLVDGWEVALVDPRPELALELMLDHVFTAGASVRGWRVDVVCVPLKYYDRLSEADRAALAGVLMVEAELRRKGELNAEVLPLSREKPEGQVLLSRTVGDFVRRAVVAEFEYRHRSISAREVGPWTAWQSGNGGSLSFVI